MEIEAKKLLITKSQGADALEQLYSQRGNQVLKRKYRTGKSYKSTNAASNNSGKKDKRVKYTRAGSKGKQKEMILYVPAKGKRRFITREEYNAIIAK